MKQMKKLFALGLSLCAIDATAWSQDPGCSSAEKATCCSSEKESERGTTTTLAFPLERVGAEAMQSFAQALRRLGRDSYECAGHPEATSDQPGRCDACGGASLAKRWVPAFQSIAFEGSKEAPTCRVQLTPGETVRLSSVTAASKECKVSLGIETMPLRDDSKLHLAGLTCAGCEGKAVAALGQLEGVSGCEVSFGGEAESVASFASDGTVGLTYGRIRKALEQAGLRLSDVSWTGAEVARSECD